MAVNDYTACLRYYQKAGPVSDYIRTHLWVTVSLSPIPSGTLLAFDSMCTVSGTVFIVILYACTLARCGIGDRIKLITVRQRIFDEKQ